MNRLIDISGKRFGRLTVLKRDGTDKSGLVTWTCICKCGKVIVAIGNNLKRGSTQSCGCLHKEKITKHGYRRQGKVPNEYGIWQGMLSQCYNPNIINFDRWGGRGIKVCNRWRGTNGFKNFYQDMGKRPTLKHSLDRRNNNKGYSKENCRWVNKIVQALNSRISSDNTSGSKGVSYSKERKKFESYISVNGKRTHLGRFKKLKDAVSARRTAEKKYHEPILEQAK